ncbi:TPA: hypothetical protein N3I75_003678 [Salmonella enterica subsp. enterica serovar Java]|nr:hypothetical protein [Salmonella enterica subsp. enterica serovar Java]
MKRIIVFIAILIAILSAAYYYQRDIITIPEMKRTSLSATVPFDDSYVIQVDGGTIVNTGGNGILLNGFTVLAKFDSDYKTTKIMIKPDKPGGKVTWYPLKPIGEGKYYKFFLVTDKETGEILPYTSYTIIGCNNDKYTGRADERGYSVIYLNNAKCNISITLNDF